MNAKIAELIPSLSEDQGRELARKIAALTKTGVVFSEPFSRGSYTVIPVSEHSTGKRRSFARPVAVIVVGPEGVEVQRIQNVTRSTLTRAAATGLIALGTALSFHPPWRPEFSLVEEIGRRFESRRKRLVKLG